MSISWAMVAYCLTHVISGASRQFVEDLVNGFTPLASVLTT